MCWNPYYVVLILLSTGVDFWAGLKMGAAESKKLKFKFLIFSIVVNLGLLLYFKYYNFFAGSLNEIFLASGSGSRVPLFEILLPVGISFYTFQTLGYAFDVYRERREAETHFGIFALYVAFFPQLIAGPIERSTSLIPQFKQKILLVPENLSSGAKLIIWGLFKKVVIADRLAVYVDFIYSAPETVLPGTMALASIFFAFQIYCDFSGYSDIAIGTAKLFGIELMSNFKFPNFSRNVAEYWQRWHVSLSTWFRHYIYIPLGGSRVSKLKSIRNIIIIFLVSGFWHGANWTFIFWGAFHALVFIPVFLMGRNTIYKNRVVGENSFFPSIIEIGQVLLTFAIVTFSRIFFRSESITA